jgi:uncharacterized protein YecE (DUF72 family)
VTALIGTSGWHYSDCKGHFYPGEVRQNDWLRFYAGRFETVELNNAFYRLPDRTAFQAWAEQVPDDFVVAVKASRYLTHVRRLKEPSEPVARLMAAAKGLGPKLGPVLLQLPPNLRRDDEALARTLDQFPNGVRVAVETRHDSWHDEHTREVLEARGAAWVWVDPGSRNRPRWRTADWGYVRFHRGTGRPEPCYTRSPLQTWAKRIAGTWDGDDVFCYFNNDTHACAPRDARRFASAVSRAGLSPSRVPRPRETPVAAR